MPSTFHQTTLLAFASVCLMTASADGATVIFEDSFDRPLSDTVGNGWTEYEGSADRVGINNDGRLRLRGIMEDIPDAAASSPIIDATGYDNITVTFSWRKRTSNNINDMLKLSFANTPLPSLLEPGDWTQVFSGSTDSPADFDESVILTGAANATFGLLFWTVDSINSSGFTIRELTVTGDRISAIPVPAGLPLMLMGLGALGLARRYGRHSEKTRP